MTVLVPVQIKRAPRAERDSVVCETTVDVRHNPKGNMSYVTNKPFVTQSNYPIGTPGFQHVPDQLEREQNYLRLRSR